jgi:NAD(P)-dependent dehydrogenase (short-subunit alcohol dehydrogenase family)
MMDVAGAVIVVTGGGSGIGRATAQLLHGQGATCVIVDRDEVTGKAVAAEIGGAFVKADVADEEEVTRAVAATVELGPLRGLVNAAGIGRGARTVDRDGVPHSLKEFELVLRVNLVGTFNCLRIAGAAMSKSDPVDDAGTRGAIVNLASVAAFDGQIGQAAYAASKGGVVSMTLPIARDLAAVGIRESRGGRKGRARGGAVDGEHLGDEEPSGHKCRQRSRPARDGAAAVRGNRR